MCDNKIATELRLIAGWIDNDHVGRDDDISDISKEIRDYILDRAERLSPSPDWNMWFTWDVYKAIPHYFKPLRTKLDLEKGYSAEWWCGAHKLTIYLSSKTPEYLKVWGDDLDSEMESGTLNSFQEFITLWSWLTNE